MLHGIYNVRSNLYVLHRGYDQPCTPVGVNLGEKDWRESSRLDTVTKVKEERLARVEFFCSP